MFSSTCRFEEADETYLPFAQSPEADAERRRIISSLNIEPSVFCYAFNAPPIFTLSRLFPEVKVANTFIHVKSQDPDAFVARRSASSPNKMFKVISPSKQQQQSEAVRPEANQGGVASAEHVGLESPGRSSTQQQHQHQHQYQQQRQQLAMLGAQGLASHSLLPPAANWPATKGPAAPTKGVLLAAEACFEGHRAAHGPQNR
mmetsp:Transcript_88483/g.159527  ORF Transcript_88483/g.159527 Transcript_88483/m.159527 type:complete len:202 (+) Transcript_88483:96-701(+)